MLILLWGLPTERPLAAVADALHAAGETPVLVDQRRASAMRASLVVDNEVSGQLAIGAQSYDLAAVTAAYVRPYDTYVLNPPRADGTPKQGLRRALAIDETLAAWCDATPALVLNRPAAMASNSSKPYQLQLIRAAGFAVPETLVTTDREAVEAFRESHGELIYKSVSSIRSRVSQLTDEHSARLDDLAACPTQFQQFIPGRDYRVHVVGGAVFASALRCEADDYRYPDGEPLEVSAATLPDDIADRCVRLAGALELPLAGIDLRRTPDGAWYCFEVNPSPAFTYYSARTGQPIAEAIAALLLQPSGASEAHPLLCEAGERGHPGGCVLRSR